MKAGSLFRRGYPFSMTMLLFITLIVFMLWTTFFKIDQTVLAQGLIIPIARTQIIQAADGGVLSKILVQEGQTVTAGQPLAILEKDRSNVAYEEGRKVRTTTHKFHAW